MPGEYLDKCKTCGHARHEHSKLGECFYDYSMSDWSIDVCSCNHYEPSQAAESEAPASVSRFGEPSPNPSQILTPKKDPP